MSQYNQPGNHETDRSPSITAQRHSERSANAQAVPLAEYADRLAEELHSRIEHQRELLRHIAERLEGPCKTCCPLVQCPRLQALQGAIRETIVVLEQTRSAFKSKRLEVMRRKLIDLLSHL